LTRCLAPCQERARGRNLIGTPGVTCSVTNGSRWGVRCPDRPTGLAGEESHDDHREEGVHGAGGSDHRSSFR
jgi:hypothetical protein